MRAAGAAAASRRAAAARRVLVVDDNLDAAESLRHAAAAAAATRSTVAHDGPGAVAAVGAFAPEVVAARHRPAGAGRLRGGAAAARAPAAPRSLLVAITGYGQEEDRQRSRDAGFDHHLTKPIDPVSLMALLKTSLDQGVERC